MKELTFWITIILFLFFYYKVYPSQIQINQKSSEDFSTETYDQMTYQIRKQLQKNLQQEFQKQFDDLKNTYQKELQQLTMKINRSNKKFVELQQAVSKCGKNFYALKKQIHQNNYNTSQQSSSIQQKDTTIEKIKQIQFYQGLNDAQKVIQILKNMDLAQLDSDFLDLDRQYNGITLLEISKQNNIDSVTQYIEKIQCKKYDKGKFLQYCKSGNSNAVQCCIKRNVDVQVQQKNGQNCLIIASHHGHYEIVKALLNEQVDIEVQEKKGQTTALMQASRQGHLNIVQELLLKGSKIGVKSMFNLTALDYAKYGSHQQVVDFLIDYQEKMYHQKQKDTDQNESQKKIMKQKIMKKVKATKIKKISMKVSQQLNTFYTKIQYKNFVQIEIFCSYI